MSETISDNLFNALRRLNRQMHRHGHRMMPPRSGLHRGQMHLLLLISQNDGIIQRDLAEQMDLRPSSLTEMLVNLEQNSLIVRKQDEKDRRVIHVYLTDAGKTSIEGFVQANDKLSASIFNCLTRSEIEKMLEIANKINANLEEMDDTESSVGLEEEGVHHGRWRHNRHHNHGGEDEPEFSKHQKSKEKE